MIMTHVPNYNLVSFLINSNLTYIENLHPGLQCIIQKRNNVIELYPESRMIGEFVRLFSDRQYHIYETRQ